MYFIQIVTRRDYKEFINIMDTKYSFRDTDNFLDWLKQRKAFPFEFYLNGVVYFLKDRKELELFQAGFEAGANVEF